jgi:hypothetical protein
MHFLYVISCKRKSEQFLVTVITNRTELQLRKDAFAGYNTKVLLFVPNSSHEYLERVKRNLYIEGVIVPAEKQITLEGSVCHAKMSIQQVSINWEELVKEQCPECTLLHVHLQGFPIPILYVRHAGTGKAVSLPADVWFNQYLK